MQQALRCQFFPLSYFRRHAHSCVQRFKSALRVQWFLSTYDQIVNVFACAKTTAPPQSFGPSAVSRSTTWAKMNGVALETTKVRLSPLQFVVPCTKRLL